MSSQLLTTARRGDNELDVCTTSLLELVVNCDNAEDRFNQASRYMNGNVSL